MFFRLRIFRLWQNEFSDHRMLRVEARLGRAESYEALDQETSAGEKQQRQCDLRDDEQTAELMRLGSNCAAASFLQRLVHVRPRHLKRGDQPEEKRAENCHGECKEKHGRIDRDFAEARNILRTENAKKIHSPPGNEQTAGGTEDRQQETFTKKLPHHPHATCAERSA